MHKVTAMSLCPVYDQNVFLLTKQTSVLSLPSLCVTVCDSHICVTQGAAAVSGFYCCWY